MRTTRTLLPSLALILIAPAARADLFGITESQMYLQLMQIVETAQRQLEQAKKIYDVTSELYALSQSESTSLDRILNTELVDYMREKGWMVSGLDLMRDLADLDRQLAYLGDLLEQTDDPDTRAQLQAAIDLLKQQRAVLKLTQHTDKNLRKAATDLSERDSARITAENTAVLARQALAEQDRLNRQDAARKAAASDIRRFTRGAAKIYKNLDSEPR